MSDILSYLYDLFTWVLDGALLIIQSALYFVYDGFLTAVTAVINSLDLSFLIFEFANKWGLLPDQLLYVICQIGLSQCISILVYALGIRMLLNLIPASLTRI